jgi:site-specific DNA-adenine methylase
MIISTQTENVLLEFEKFKRNVSTRSNAAGELPIKEAVRFVPPWTNKAKQLFPPFTYFGGKRDIAQEVWRRFGWDIPNYIEPFAGGLAVLLARPVFDLRDLKRYRELANDTNLFLVNFWRSVQQENIEDLIRLMNFPAHEREMLDRRAELMKRAFELKKRLKSVKDCDVELAAYWLYVQRQWIGDGADDLNFVPGTKMIRAKECGFTSDSIEEDLRFLQERTRYTRFYCGDWRAPLKKPTQTINIGTTGVFLDPPYINTTGYYKGRLDKSDPGNEVPLIARDWALKYGKYPQFRIAYCGYLHHHDGVFPEGGENGWIKLPWRIKNGYSKPGEDKTVEIDTVWFSPHCTRFPEDPD